MRREERKEEEEGKQGQAGNEISNKNFFRSIGLSVIHCRSNAERVKYSQSKKPFLPPWDIRTVIFFRRSSPSVHLTKDTPFLLIHHIYFTSHNQLETT